MVQLVNFSLRLYNIVLLNEYGADCYFRHLDFIKACWVKYEDKEDIAELLRLRSHNLFYDKHDNLVFMAESEYQLNAAKEKNPKAKFLTSIEHNTETVQMENVA